MAAATAVAPAAVKAQASAAPAVAAGGEGTGRKVNEELWYACAGPLVALPPAGSLVVYFPQGHSQQVAASMQKNADGHVPSYPNLPTKLICLLHDVTLHADQDTDEVYAQMTLQPVSTYEKQALLLSELALKQTRPQLEFFCKALTASDTSTHGGFSVPRRAAERVFPALDFSVQPPAQELQARDLHDNSWSFRHIYRGQPKRHLLTTGWSLFVSGKRLAAGDSVLFVRDTKQQLLVGIRRANKQRTSLQSSVLSSDSMHIGILAEAAHAAVNQSPFTIFYNPRASVSEFVVPFAKYQKSVYGNQLSLGMRFRMMFETEESGTRRYMGTITGISDLDPVRWKNSQWRNLQVTWDEAVPGERRNRVSIWEIEPVIAPFFICPSPFFRPKRPRQPWMPDDEMSEMENLFKRAMPWLGEEICIKDPQTQSTIMPGLSLAQWMSMQQNSSVNANSVIQPDFLLPLAGQSVQSVATTDLSKQQLISQAQFQQQSTAQLNTSRPPSQQSIQSDQPSGMPVVLNQPGTGFMQRPDQELSNQKNHQLVAPPVPLCQSADVALPQVLNEALLQPVQHCNSQQKQQITTPSSPSGRVKASFVQPQVSTETQLAQSNPSVQMTIQQMQLLQQQQNQLLPQLAMQHQQNALLAGQLPFTQFSDNIKLQLLQRLQQQQASLDHQNAMQASQQAAVLDEHKIFRDVNPQLKVKPLVEQGISNAMPTKGSLQGNGSLNAFQLQSQMNLQRQQHVLLQDNNPSKNNAVIAPSSFHAVGKGCSLPMDDDALCSSAPQMNNAAAQVSLKATNGHNMSCAPAGSQPAPAMFTSAYASPETIPTKPANHQELLKPSHTAQQLAPLLKMKDQSAGITQECMNNISQLEYLDSSSSATSVCLSQTDSSMRGQNLSMSPFGHLHLLPHPVPDCDFQGVDQTNNFLFGMNNDSPFSIPLDSDAFLANSPYPGNYSTEMLRSGNLNCTISNDRQQDMPSTSATHSMGVPDVPFNSIDSVVHDNNLFNGNLCSQAPPLQRIRTFRKVHKRGAVGRSIDIASYSGYDELRKAIARLFGLELKHDGQLVGGWKLVYEDHEKDVLLIGDDPWGDFVNCVRCIRILSPQEEMNISCDNNAAPNQACSSSCVEGSL